MGEPTSAGLLNTKNEEFERFKLQKSF